MSKIAELVAYVSDWKYGTDEPNPSWAMKVSEPHYKKEGNKYVKIGSTNYTIKAAYGVDIDFTQFRQGEKVIITGTQLSEEWESNGKKGKNLIIKATSVMEMQYKPEWREAGTVEPERLPNDWVELDKDAPF